MLGGAAQRAGFAVFELMTLVFERGDALQQRVLGFEQLAFGLLRSALLGEEFLTAVEFACLRGQRGELLCGVGEGGVGVDELLGVGAGAVEGGEGIARGGKVGAPGAEGALIELRGESGFGGGERLLLLGQRLAQAFGVGVGGAGGDVGGIAARVCFGEGVRPGAALGVELGELGGGGAQRGEVFDQFGVGGTAGEFARQCIARRLLRAACAEVGVLLAFEFGVAGMDGLQRLARLGERRAQGFGAQVEGAHFAQQRFGFVAGVLGDAALAFLLAQGVERGGEGGFAAGQAFGQRGKGGAVVGFGVAQFAQAGVSGGSFERATGGGKAVGVGCEGGMANLPILLLGDEGGACAGEVAQRLPPLDRGLRVGQKLTLRLFFLRADGKIGL